MSAASASSPSRGPSRTTSRRSSAPGAEVRELDPGPRPAAAALAECDGLLLTGGVDVDPREYGETATPSDGRDVDPVRDATSSRSRAGARARPAAAGDLPRRAGAERRRRRHAGPGHSERARRRRSSTRFIEPRNAVAHDVAVKRRTRAWRRCSRPISTATAALPSTAGIISRSETRRPASSSRRRRPTASSRRSRRPPRASASACSGIRRTSGGPASSRRCSRGLRARPRGTSCT